MYFSRPNLFSWKGMEHNEKMNLWHVIMFQNVLIPSTIQESWHWVHQLWYYFWHNLHNTHINTNIIWKMNTFKMCQCFKMSQQNNSEIEYINREFSSFRHNPITPDGIIQTIVVFMYLHANIETIKQIFDCGISCWGLHCILVYIQCNLAKFPFLYVRQTTSLWNLSIDICHSVLCWGLHCILVSIQCSLVPISPNFLSFMCVRPHHYETFQ